MSTAPGASAPFSAAEKHATAVAAASSPPASAAAAAAAKQRSCITCRRRKVRCDKLTPCSNCRRADIPCVLPSTERPPRWARRLKQQHQHQDDQQQQERQHGRRQDMDTGSSSQSPGANPPPLASALLTSSPLAGAGPGQPADVSAVLGRLKQLEALVRDLSSASSAAAQASAPAPPPTAAAVGTRPLQERFGRLILDDDASNRRRYVSSGFWSRINDELDVLRAETGTLADGEDGYDSIDSDADADHQPGSSSPAAAAAADRSAFLFGHNFQPGLGDVSRYRPLPSQIPFLFQVYIVNVNMLGQVVHVPTVNKIITGLLDDATAHAEHQSGHRPLTPATEALMFAIYYAAVVSMEDEDVRVL